MVTAMPAVRTKVLVALSGGVDSSVCAYLLKEQGYDVTAVVMKMSPLHDDTVEAAKQAAAELKIPLTVLDLQEQFRANVIDYFVRSYRLGITPNPCVVCNPTVKFKALIDEADRQGCAFAATGHYAQIIEEDGVFHILRGESKQRDQSYMLYRLTQRELSRLMFPLSHLQKDVVRAIAHEAKLSAFNKPDSQENCFIAGKDYASFIEQESGKLPAGELIAPDGSVCGMHNGIPHYTVGQRKHLGVALGRAVFVREIDPVTNRIYLADAENDSYTEAIVEGQTATAGAFPAFPFTALAKIRSAATPVPVTVNGHGSTLHVTFDTPQRAVAKGQSLVLYDGDRLLGGGFIASAT